MIKNAILYNEDFKLDWHDPDEATDGYQLKWIGKDYARLQTGTATETVIIPDNEHNKKEENITSENLFFTGDNLEVLKHLQNAYSNSIKMIYIDPPYNTGKEFTYCDKFEFSDEKLKDMLGLTDEEIKRLHSINGKSSHSAWLTFMYPRLRIAQKLLTDDGVIFISIDDNEQANLKLLCDGIFNEQNFIGTIPRITKKSGKEHSESVAKNHDYVLIYSKNNFNIHFSGLSNTVKGFDYSDEFVDTRGKFKLNQTLDYDSLWYNPTMDFELKIGEQSFYPGGSKILHNKRHAGEHNKKDWVWRWSKAKFDFGYQNGFVVLKKGIDRPRIYTKTYTNAKIEKNIAGNYYINYEARENIISSLNFIDNKYSNDNAKKDLATVIDPNYFDFPKPISLIYDFMKLHNTKNDIILDFFAGSSTTAHAIMQLNAEDGGNRKFIMVQLPEEINEESKAKKQGFNTIDEISRKRIELASKKIKEEKNADIDYGFKHYYVKEVENKTISKIEEFDPEKNFIGSENMIREFDNEKSNGEDVILTTWLVDDGYKLNTKPEIKDICGYKAYYMDNSTLYLISPDWGTEQTKELLNLVGNNKFNLNTIIIYGYSFNFEAMKELEINIKQNLNNNISIEKRY